MSESDDMLSSVDWTESVSGREESQGETSDEMKVVGQYADQPLAHSLLLPQFKYMNFHIFTFISSPQRVYNEFTQ